MAGRHERESKGNVSDWEVNWRRLASDIKRANMAVDQAIGRNRQGSRNARKGVTYLLVREFGE